MNRRSLLLGLVVAPALAASAQAALSTQDGADITRAEASLNAIHTLKARFQQIAPDGAISDGTVWLQRPGRMRFQYDQPSPYLLVAGHGLLVFNDSQLGQTSNIPLDRTPLGLLLQADVKLSGGVTVSQVTRLPNQVQITCYRTATPGEGSITMIFADPPMALVAWVVLDAQRRETRIRLADVQRGGSFAQSLFTFIDPRAFGGNPNLP